MIRGGSSMAGGVQPGAANMQTLTIDDIDDLRQQTTLLQGVSPEVRAGAQVIGGGKNWSTQITGVDPEYDADPRVGNGDWELFTDRDVKSRAKVAVLGKEGGRCSFPRPRPGGPEDPHPQHALQSNRRA